MEDFSADRLRAARNETGMTQRDFADKLGIGLRTLRRFESGRSVPKLLDLKRICQVTGKPFDYFLSSEGTTTP